MARWEPDADGIGKIGLRGALDLVQVWEAPDGRGIVMSLVSDHGDEVIIELPGLMLRPAAELVISMALAGRADGEVVAAEIEEGIRRVRGDAAVVEALRVAAERWRCE